MLWKAYIMYDVLEDNSHNWIGIQNCDSVVHTYIRTYICCRLTLSQICHKAFSYIRTYLHISVQACKYFFVLQPVLVWRVTMVTWLKQSHTYGAANLKLDAHFGLLTIVHRFYLNHSSKPKCYLHVVLVVSRISLASDRIQYLYD